MLNAIGPYITVLAARQCSGMPSAPKVLYQTGRILGSALSEHIDHDNDNVEEYRKQVNKDIDRINKESYDRHSMNGLMIRGLPFLGKGPGFMTE